MTSLEVVPILLLPPYLIKVSCAVSQFHLTTQVNYGKIQIWRRREGERTRLSASTLVTVLD